jgi:uncharacterized membrane protein
VIGPVTLSEHGESKGDGTCEMGIVTLLYYALVAFVSVILVVNLLRSKKWERDALYVLVLLPFLLRLLRLK